jgi:SAM-dependent methyltransferase/ribosomal protein S18 acetylase RimI-like enzyme
VGLRDVAIEPFRPAADDLTASVLDVQHRAYRVEADLIGFDGIPPLHEHLDELRAQPLEWRVARIGARIVGAIGWTTSGRSADIDRLFVDPLHLRHGIARALVASIGDHDIVTVSTGTANAPAVSLYLSLGFKRMELRELAPGITATRFERWALRFGASFDADVGTYERARPGYPAELFEHLHAVTGLGTGTRVLEIGAGPGLGTMPMLDRGAVVTAVEPGPNMVARLRERTIGRACTVVPGTFEEASLTGPFDVAVSFTAFHWVDPTVGWRRLAELVRPGGWVALVWNLHGRADRREDDPWERAIDPIVRRYQPHQSSSHRPYALDVEARRHDVEANGSFEHVEHRRFTWPHRHDATSMRDLFASFSDWSTLPEPDRSEALDAMAATVDRVFGGSVERTYTTALHLARRR